MQIRLNIVEYFTTITELRQYFNRHQQSTVDEFAVFHSVRDSLTSYIIAKSGFDVGYIILPSAFESIIITLNTMRSTYINRSELLYEYIEDNAA